MLKLMANSKGWLKAREFNIINLRSWQHRSICCTGFILFLAGVLNHFISFSNGYWLVLTAFFVSQISLGAPLRYGFQAMVVLTLVLLFAAFLLTLIELPIVVYSITGLIFLGIGYFLFKFRPQASLMISHIVMYALLLVLTMLTLPEMTSPIKHDISDIAMGGFLAIICVGIFLHVSLAKIFRHGVSDFLKPIIQYAEALVDCRLLQKLSDAQLAVAKKSLENIFIQASVYPEWVYEKGFNPGLRSGFRFFLIHLERVVENYTALNYLFSRKLDERLFYSLHDVMLDAMQKNIELLIILKNYFAQNVLTETRSDFTSDITRLEKKTTQFLPNNLELLDISPDYLTLTAIVRDIKDIRGTLLQLLSALPEAPSLGEAQR